MQYNEIRIDCVFSGIREIEVCMSITTTGHHYPVLVFWPSLTPDLNTIAEATDQLLSLKIVETHNNVEFLEQN